MTTDCLYLNLLFFHLFLSQSLRLCFCPPLFVILIKSLFVSAYTSIFLYLSSFDLFYFLGCLLLKSFPRLYETLFNIYIQVFGCWKHSEIYPRGVAIFKIVLLKNHLITSDLAWHINHFFFWLVFLISFYSGNEQWKLRHMPCCCCKYIDEQNKRNVCSLSLSLSLSLTHTHTPCISLSLSLSLSHTIFYSWSQFHLKTSE